jgi:toxin ParE1/3/4
MPPKLKIRFIPEAVKDLHSAAHWYEEQRKGLGSAFMLSIEAGLATLQRNPEHFAKVEGDLRRIVIKRFPYGIFFIVESEIILVTAIFHSSRNPVDRTSIK